MQKISQDYVINKLQEGCNRIKYDSRKDVYNCECPFCHEGSSRGRSRRFYYMVDDDWMYCHNCNWTGNSIKFIMELYNMSFKEIMDDTDSITISSKRILKEKDIPIVVDDLPNDVINLCDRTQLDFYKKNPIIKLAVEYLKSRRMYSAKYRPKSYYISLTDFKYKNRIIIPFYDQNNKIIFYQARTFLENDVNNDELPKYISKEFSEKSLFNINKIDESFLKLFLCEGPIDATFLKNSVALTGVNMTDTQRNQLSNFFLHDKIWVLDNQWKDETSLLTSENLILKNESIFIWPEELKQYKDINDYCMDKQLNEFDYNIILNNTFSGMAARMKLQYINLSYTRSPQDEFDQFLKSS